MNCGPSIHIPGKNNPALFIGFNRPLMAADSLWRIIDADPLYLFADAPRNDTKTEHEQMLALFDCVHKKRAGKRTEIYVPERNLGQRDGPWAAIRWFLQAEGAGCIVEEDILVEPGFLKAYGDALRSERKNRRIYAVSSTTKNPQFELGDHPWVESKMLFVWGWATWWDKISDVQVPNNLWNDNRSEIFKAFPRFASRLYMAREFDMLAKNSNYCWSYYVQQQKLLAGEFTLIPAAKLSRNIGISPESLRTKKTPDGFPDGAKIEKMRQNLNNPAMGYSKSIESRIEAEKHGSLVHELRNRLKLGSLIKKLCLPAS